MSIERFDVVIVGGGNALPTSPQLSPIATYQGDIVGRNIVEGPL